MAFRSDITVEWYSSPRYIEIAAPSTNVTLQDLHDTLADIQDSIEGTQFPDLVESGGKLGGGVTGIAITLQNAQVLFEPRTTVIESGTVTTPDTTGKTLTDSTATFVTNGVARGDLVENTTDGSYATVLSVESETSLTTLPLAGGTDNQYDSSDAYEVYDYELCTVTGGDIFAVDDVGADITPILTSFGVTGPIVEQDTSPAAAPATMLDALLTESYPADGVSSVTMTQLLYSINQLLTEFARSGTTVSVKKRDGTEAFQLTLDSATAPTTSTQSS